MEKLEILSDGDKEQYDNMI